MPTYTHIHPSQQTLLVLIPNTNLTTTTIFDLSTARPKWRLDGPAIVFTCQSCLRKSLSPSPSHQDRMAVGHLSSSPLYSPNTKKCML